MAKIARIWLCPPVPYRVPQFTHPKGANLARNGPTRAETPEHLLSSLIVCMIAWRRNRRARLRRLSLLLKPAIGKSFFDLLVQDYGSLFCYETLEIHKMSTNK
jgi:hypothetical protein